MNSSTYINDMDANVALEILQRENPTKVFKIHQKGYVVRRRGSNEKFGSEFAYITKSQPFVLNARPFIRMTIQ